ncbi:MAG TPA: tetratricopeptide repeat protein [Candidatus Krumholzibacteria bacterium]|nr:tetratricopeptide repeat protein [Candidatus Krumholzibacteria bacterium]
MRYHRVILASLLVLGVAAGSVRGGNEPVKKLVTEWNREGLFDSTTTRGELLEMGRSAATLQHYPLAEIYFQEALLRNPTDVDAMCELAALYKRTNRLEYARGLLLRAGTLSPMRTGIADMRKSVDAALFSSLSHTVDSLMTAGRFDEALPRIATLLSIDANSVPALVAKAKCLAVAGQTDAALSCVDLAITHEPTEELHNLRAEIAARVEHERVSDMEASARRLIDSGDWVRGQAIDVLQSILAQDPSNEWAREQFRRLSTPDGADSAAAQAPPSTAVSRAVHSVMPEITGFLDRYLLAILAFFFAWAIFRSPLSRAIASRLHQPTTLSGDVAHISIAAALKTANDLRMTGMLTVKSAEGRSRVYLEYGDPIHCEAMGKKGTEALIDLLREVEQGTFDLVPGRKKVKRTIDDSFQIILTQADPHAASAMGIATARRPKKSKMAELLETGAEK